MKWNGSPRSALVALFLWGHLKHTHRTGVRSGSSPFLSENTDTCNKHNMTSVLPRNSLNGYDTSLVDVASSEKVIFSEVLLPRVAAVAQAFVGEHLGWVC